MSLDSVAGGGTVERVFQLHTSMCSMEGVSSRVLSMHVGEPVLNESDDVLLLPCWSKRWYFPATRLLTMFRMVRWADVIHVMNHWTILNAVICKMARLTDTPYVICPAGALPLFGRSQGLKLWYNCLVGHSLVKNSDAAVVIAEDEIATLNQYGVMTEHIQHIPNGVRADDFSCVDEQLFRKFVGIGNVDYLLFVGRLNEIKGPDILLDAFIALSSTFPELHLVFAGPDGGMLRGLKDRAAKAALGERVHFPGYVRGELKSSAYHGSSLLVVPSRQEAMSIVALEGAICARPVVLTDCCGFDLLAEAGAARLTAANSHTMSQIISELMLDLTLRDEMGAKGRQLAISFYTWDIAARRYLTLFRNCLRENVL
ncbi:MAG: glycosyltransferase [Mariprofundaceae bacterium]